MKSAAELSTRLYRWLARSFPEEFLRAHGQDMVQLSEDLIQDAARRGGLAGLAVLMSRLLPDLLWRSVVEHCMELRQDVLYGARMLWRSKVFTLASVVSLGIGIGVGTSTYQQVRSFYFSDSPGVRATPDLVRLQGPVSYQDYEAFRGPNGQFSAAAAYMAPVPFLLTANGQTQRVWGHLVTPNYLEVLSARIALGNSFGPETQHRDAPAQVIVSRRLWEERLGGDRSLVGRPLKINGDAATLVGVTDSGFQGASPMMALADLWIPVSSQSRIAPELAAKPLEDGRVAAFNVFGRLKPGVGMLQAEAALDARARQLEQERHDPNRDRKGRRVTLLPGGRLMPLRDRDRAAATTFPVVLVGLMLWIACSNVATLLLARAAARRREIAIRLAMGAGRWRLVRQLLTESVMLAVLGGIAGYLLAVWSNTSMDWLRPILPEYVNMQIESDWTALAFTLALGAATGILFGLAPALQATRAGIAPALKEGASSRLPGYRWFSTRNMMVLQQITGSLMLLLLTGFMVIGVKRSATPDMGFDPRHLYRMSLDPVREGYTAEAVQQFFTKLLERVRRLPGVQSAAISFSIPLEPFGSGESAPARTDAASSSGDDQAQAVARMLGRIETERVGAGFFETAGVRLLAGRTLRNADQNEDGRVTVVNETLANDLHGGREVVGRVLEVGGERLAIVGVVANIRTGGLFTIAQKRAYVPLRPSALAAPGPKGVGLLVRAEPAVGADELVRAALAELDPNLTLFDVKRMEDRVAETLLLVRFTLLLYGGIGVFSLILAAVGLAGVTAYAVAQRGKEIGIRMALGAQPGAILRLVMREGTVLVVAGTVLGMACSYGMVRLMSRFLDMLAQVTATSLSDPVLVAGAPLLLAALTLLACYLPARRSTRIDPVVALRQE